MVALPPALPPAEGYKVKIFKVVVHVQILVCTLKSMQRRLASSKIATNFSLKNGGKNFLQKNTKKR